MLTTSSTIFELFSQRSNFRENEFGYSGLVYDLALGIGRELETSLVNHSLLRCSSLVPQFETYHYFIDFFSFCLDGCITLLQRERAYV